VFGLGGIGLNVIHSVRMVGADKVVQAIIDLTGGGGLLV
jgi:Zn-dependent alcohol dehydrogenase